jgi:hypothetical protein
MAILMPCDAPPARTAPFASQHASDRNFFLATVGLTGWACGKDG